MLQLPINFGLVIAYFLPGMVVTYSLRYVSLRIDYLLQRVESGQALLGPGLFLLIAAVVAGLIVSAARMVVFEPILYRTGVGRPNVNYKALASPETLSVYIQVVDNVYRFYQFYGNIFLALLLMALLRYAVAGAAITSSLAAVSLFMLTVGAILALFIAARLSMKQLCQALDDLCN
ncbi:MAG TPA: hypothetical protein VHG32_10825 [Thermoanaerobaculia bacterium]|jgi:hypothetical protein|nr:hypothetical protein [Thermoanaerobaculia bacterium]